MNMNFSLKSSETEKRTVIVANGEIDAFSAPILKEKLLNETAKKDREVIVDLKNVSYMDSTGLGVFISALKSAKEHESELTLMNLQIRVRRLFRITNLDTIFIIKSTLRGER